MPWLIMPWRRRSLQEEAAVRKRNQPGLGWTVVLRRQPARIVEGRVHGGYTDMYELICWDCGDHPRPDYHDVSPELQRIPGPYRFAVGAAAYEEHVTLCHRQEPPSSRASGCTTPAGNQPALAGVSRGD